LTTVPADPERAVDQRRRPRILAAQLRVASADAVITRGVGLLLVSLHRERDV
jgi:hypothetical protein